MYTEKCIREFNAISNALHRDISRLAGNDQEIAILVNGYIAYYAQQNIIIQVTDMSHYPGEAPGYDWSVVTYTWRETGQYIHITGVLPAPVSHFQLDYFYNISAYVDAMRRI